MAESLLAAGRISDEEHAAILAKADKLLRGKSIQVEGKTARGRLDRPARRQYAPGGLVSDDADERMPRKIQERAMRGYEPTEEQQAYLDKVAPEKEERSRRLGEPLGAVLKRLQKTGIAPAYRRGGAADCGPDDPEASRKRGNR
ncbi:MAG: hypothetical protein EKK41_21165 [Hyphomicrobiales bacterium]|nr:MAG: hypothetical protein EKK41_21165 [Hyphomicrobiales bacterium]